MIDFAGVPFKNPVVTASGTFGYGVEFKRFFDPSKLGGLTFKALTLEKRLGNPHPRIAETEAGLINSVGLQNEGLAYFVEHVYPLVKDIPTNLIVNLSANSLEEYVALTKAVTALPNIRVIELNVSCPNIHAGRIEFGTDPIGLEKLVRACVDVSTKPIMPKLSPNVTSITDVARACEAGGAKAVSLINTLVGMRIDIHSKKPAVYRSVGGYSGAGIKPVALRMVYEVCRTVKIPVLGMGGISNAEDAVEFLLAGATLVGVGTATLLDPRAPVKIIRGIEKYLKKNRVDYAGLRTALEPYPN